MIRILIAALLMCSLSSAFAQDVRVKRAIVNESIYLRDRWVDSLRNDTLNIQNATRSLMTAKAVYDLVNARTGIPGPQGIPGMQGEQGVAGAAGTNGLNGSVWFAAVGAPNPAIGANGDFYINQATGEYYKKNSGTWLVHGSLMGPQGATGATGAAGADGTNGTNGAKGDKGDKGEDGTSVTIKGSYANIGGLPGSGNPGDSYMVGDSLWVWDQLNANWHNVGRIKGVQGDTGPAGTPGSKWYDQNGTPNPANGAVGDFHLNRTTGDYYEKTGASTWTVRGNIRGTQGVQGVQGVKGDKGDVGDTGATGATGAAGAAGNKWYDGSGAPSSGIGAELDYYLNKTNGDIYKKVSGAWSVQGNIKGPAGSGGGGQIINIDL